MTISLKRPETPFEMLSNRVRAVGNARADAGCEQFQMRSETCEIFT
jgi:hypothetical protein